MTHFKITVTLCMAFEHNGKVYSQHECTAVVILCTTNTRRQVLKLKNALIWFGSQVAMGAVGLARRALDEATRYSLERKAFGKPIFQVSCVYVGSGLNEWRLCVNNHDEYSFNSGKCDSQGLLL